MLEPNPVIATTMNATTLSILSSIYRVMRFSTTTKGTTTPTMSKVEPTFDPNNVSDNASEWELAEAARAQFAEWQGNALVRLGLHKFTENVPADAAVLKQALATIAATGAPTPTVSTETVAYPGGPILPAGGFNFDVYTFTDPTNPANKVRSNELLLCLNPQITIGELRAARIIR